MNRTSIIIITFVSVLFLTMLFVPSLNSNTGQPQDSWPMFRHDPAHSSFSTSIPSTSNQTLWKQPTGGQVWSSPTVANGVVYVGSFDHNVYALNASTGAIIWAFSTGGEVFSSPAVSNGITYVGSLDNNTYALNASTGVQLWNFTTGGAVFSSPNVADGKVYVASDDSLIFALNAQTGER